MTTKCRQKKTARVDQDSNLSWTDDEVELLLEVVRAYFFQKDNEGIKTYQIRHVPGTISPLLLNLFVTNSQIPNHGTRTASNYRTHLCRTNLKQFTILYQGPKIWNSLPVSVTRSSNLLSFKTKMQEFLLK